MTRPFIFLLSYLLISILHLSLYFIFRPRIQRPRYRKLFIGSVSLRFVIVTVLPFWFAQIEHIINTLLDFVIVGMGTAVTLHAIFLLRDRQEWKGLFFPKGHRIPVIHGAISHLGFSIFFTIYTFILIFYFNRQVSAGGDAIVLAITFIYMLSVAAVCLISGLRMAKIIRI